MHLKHHALIGRKDKASSQLTIKLLKDIKSTFEDMQNDVVYGRMSMEDFKRLLEEDMTRKQIEAKYNIQQLPDGRFWIRIDDKLIRKKSKDALIDEIVAHEKSLDKSNQTLKDVIPDYLSYRHLTKSDGTYRQDIRYINNYILSHSIANIPIKKITLKDGVSWAHSVLEKKKMLKPKYWKNVRGVLIGILHYCNCNSLDGLDIHKDNLDLTKVEPEARIFFPDEKASVKTLAFEEAKDKMNALPLGIPLLFDSGIRTGELCALKWKDIHPDYMCIHAEMIEDSDSEGNFLGYKYVDHAKSKAGTRKIPLSKELTKIFLLVKEYNLSQGLPRGPEDFVFLRLRNGKIEKATTRCFDARLRKYCKNSGMMIFKSQHDIRRTFATELHYQGMKHEVIQKIMGHASVSQAEAYIILWKEEPEEAELELLNAINE